MRSRLERINGQRKTFRGTFVRLGSKPGYLGSAPVVTLLLGKISDESGKVLTDHLWFNYTNGFQRHSPLIEGDVFEFDARVIEYAKGLEWERTVDFKLSRPTKVRRVRDQQPLGRSPAREAGRVHVEEIAANETVEAL